ncbi:hypothetical protein HPB47_001028 [Ixodes persulcatus]|uniref:Uncharacterized protein n=1 Tax=Ixodes persulcatus TaxID=34615 RepID=A0AC60PRS7_IXOPE|nr:hypothetical protein HPB47_001028 [Ixodes persulcatus]
MRPFRHTSGFYGSRTVSRCVHDTAPLLAPAGTGVQRRRDQRSRPAPWQAVGIAQESVRQGGKQEERRVGDDARLARKSLAPDPHKGPRHLALLPPPIPCRAISITPKRPPPRHVRPRDARRSSSKGRRDDAPFNPKLTARWGHALSADQ